MAESNESDDKPYEASQKKLEDARKKGNIPRSTDLNTMAAYGGFVIALTMWGGDMILHFGEGLSWFFEKGLLEYEDISQGGMMVRVSGPIFYAISATVPLLLLPIVLVITSLLAQRAVTVTGDNIAPKLSRISPLENLKKKFGRKGLFEFFKSFAKLLLYGATLVYFVVSRQEQIIASLMLDSRHVILLLLKLCLQFMGIAFAIAAVLGVLDYTFQRAEHMRTMRMSHREMMDELKNSEGDPMLKQRRRQRGMEIARSQMLRDVKTADVVIVNPEHYAVALKWAREKGTAPVCVAKGVDEMAATIRRLAKDSQVPIYREPPTARALYASVEIGEEVQPEHYRAVAAAIRFAEAMRQKRKHRPYGSD